MLLGLALGLGERGRKVSCFLLVLKTCRLVRSIAKWLLGGVATAAKDNRLAASEGEWPAFHINEFNFPFDTQGAIIADRNLSWWHFCS